MDTHPSLPQNLWESTPPEVRAYIGTLEARLSTLASMVEALQEQNRALQEQLNQTSRNSSRPPSSDPPQSARPKRPRSQRRRGGQAGHRGHTRTLIPVEEADEIVVLKPDQCAGCHARLTGDDPTPFRHQVVSRIDFHRDSAHPTGGDRVSMASVELPGLRRDDTGALAKGGSQWHLWPPRARHSGALYGVVSPVQAHHDSGDG